MLRVTFAVLVFIGLVSSRIVPGQCAEPELQQDFQAQKYQGRWFEVVKDNGQKQEAGYDCQTANYKINDDGTLTLKNTMSNVETGDFQYVDGTATCV